MHTSIETVTDANALAQIKADQKEGLTGPKGWFNTKTGQVGLFIPSAEGITDFQATYLHEVIGHYGARELLGDRFEEVMQLIYSYLPKQDQENQMAYYRGLDAYKEYSVERLQSLIADEYVAFIAQKSGYKNKHKDIWEKNC